MGQRLSDFAARLEQLKDDFDDAAYQTLMQELDQWTAEAAVLCQNIDRQLDLSASMPAIATSEKKTLRASI